MADPRFYRRLGPFSAATIAQSLGLTVVHGDAKAAMVDTVAALDRAGQTDISFYDGKGPLPATAAGVVIVAERAAATSESASVLLAASRPRAAFAHATRMLIEERGVRAEDGAISADAVIEDGAQIGPGVVIGADAQIGAGSVLGANAVIGPGVAIGRGARIGANAVVHCALIGDHVVIGPGAVIGHAGFGVTEDAAGLIDLPHIGRVIIQDGCSIGANSTIDRGMLADTILAEQTKIDNLCHIAHNVVVGRQVRMAAFAGISGSTVIGDRVLLAGRVGIVDHATIGAGAILAAGAAVMHDVPAGEVWCGYPAKPRMQWLREVAWLARQSRAGAGKKRHGDTSD